MTDDAALVPKAPLIEAIAEVRWSLVETPQGERVDPGYRLLPGKLSDRLSPKFPVFVDLPQANVPVELMPQAVRHQFRPGAEDWPVIQLGPGVVTLNYTTDYSWTAFFEQLKELVKTLADCYPKGQHPFRISGLDLRYLSRFAVETDASWPEQLERKFGIKVGIPQPGRVADDRDAVFKNLRVAQTTWHQDIAGRATLNVSVAYQDEAPFFLMDLLVQARGSDLPTWPVDDWYDRAHTHIHEWFKVLNREGMR